MTLRAPAPPEVHVSQLALDVRAGLGGPGQKTLPSKYLYDEVGSALFEAICELQEYGLTRADARILTAHAAEIVARAGDPLVVAELGSGTGQKTRWVLEALAASRRPVLYHPIDIAPTALERCVRELGTVRGVRVKPLASDYLPGLARASRGRRRGEPMLVLFLGSTIGNFDPDPAVAFLTEVRSLLSPGDTLLLGTDLVKPIETLLDAYDDPAGVTAAFNMNLLARMNRELGADFDLRRFAHLATYDPARRRVEMHLEARSTMRVRIPGADLVVRFTAGETIWTESSYKFTREEPAEMARRAGFGLAGQWCDTEWPFAETLFAAE
jgi:dimethylhistidine N-methyltransferase